MFKRIVSACLLLAFVALHNANAESPTDTIGWRQNYTGLFPDAKVPTHWSLQSAGIIADLRCAAAENDKGQPVTDGFLNQWLVLGPIDVKDSVADFDAEQIAGEAQLSAKEGEKSGDLAWKKLEIPPPDRFTFGVTELRHVDLAQVIDFKLNEIAYAQTWLIAEKAGKVRVVVEHGHGMKVWLNGAEVYKNPARGEGIGSYVGVSRAKLDYTWPQAPSFELDLKPGANRLLVKMSSANKGGWKDLRFSMWLEDLPATKVESKNIQWRTEMPERSTSTPILVGDKLFVMAEPDQLLCVDSRTGKILWSHYINYYEALTPEEKTANPEFAQQIDPLVKDLENATAEKDRLPLRKKIADLLKKIDKDRFDIKMEGHLSSHFGVVGFTTPMPCSDGKSVYVFIGTGVAACFDLDGNRKWITRLNAEHLVYPAGGALIAGKFVIFFKEMIAFDAATGKESWRQPEVTKTSGSLLPAKLAGTDVVISQLGEIVRVSDGHMLWRNPEKIPGDTGWNPPVVIGDTVFLPWCGTGALKIFDYSKCAGDDWQPEKSSVGGISQNKKASGEWLDKWSAGSPLIHDGMAYLVDMYGTFYAVDLKTAAVAYRKDLPIRGLQHYNAIGVAASPTLLGKNIYVMDNQGTTFVIEPGREFKLLSENRIWSQLQRTVALPPQEILSYSAPITDGTRIFLRGEKYLYCIGENPTSLQAAR